MPTITDSYVMEIATILHGKSTIQPPVIYPQQVEKSTPFDITYTCKNTGDATDTLYAHLLVGGVELTGSLWQQSVPVGGTVTKTYNHPGILTTTTIVLETGRI